MTTSNTEVPDVVDPTAAPCGFPDLADIDNDTQGVVEPALRHFAAAADYARGAQAASGVYSAAIAVDALHVAIAAASEITALTAPYIGGIWPNAEQNLRAAAALLAEAGQRLTAARHTTRTEPPIAHRTAPVPLATTSSAEVTRRRPA